MGNTKFTPGPHTLDSIFADIDGYKIVKEGRVPRLLAVVKNQDSAPVYEAQANAHLYAAAPEMYEALEGINSLFGPDIPFILTKLHGLMTNGDQDKIDAVFGKIMHAIAKAEGIHD